MNYLQSDVSALPAPQFNNIPSVSLALPPVGWQRTLEHEPQRTTDCALENTVVMAKHPSKRQFGISVVRSDGMSHTWTFYIHEIRVGRLHETLEFVLLALMFRRRVQQIDG